MPRVELNAGAPDFTLQDFNVKTVSLADFTGQKNVLVVFGDSSGRSAVRICRSCAGTICRLSVCPIPGIVC